MRPPVRELIRKGLSCAALQPGDGLASEKKTGVVLFPATQVGKEAGSYVVEHGLLESSEVAGACPHLTEKGWAWLREQGAPVLNDFLRQLEQWKEQDRLILAKVKENITRLDQMSAALRKFLGVDQSSLGEKIETNTGNIEDLILSILAEGHSGKGGTDVPLPELFRALQAKSSPGVTPGQFHDTLRRMHGTGKLLLHPWTGTMYGIPEPALAFLSGHEVAYYASLPAAGTS